MIIFHFTKLQSVDFQLFTMVLKFFDKMVKIFCSSLFLKHFKV